MTNDDDGWIRAGSVAAQPARTTIKRPVRPAPKTPDSPAPAATAAPASTPLPTPSPPAAATPVVPVETPAAAAPAETSGGDEPCFPLERLKSKTDLPASVDLTRLDVRARRRTRSRVEMLTRYRFDRSTCCPRSIPRSLACPRRSTSLCPSGSAASRRRTPACSLTSVSLDAT